MVDVVLSALAQALPERACPAAWAGAMNNWTFGGHPASDGTPFTACSDARRRHGRAPPASGLDGVQTHMTNTLNTQSRPWRRR